MPETETRIELTYNAGAKRYSATVYDNAGVKVYVSVRSTKASALWNAQQFVAYHD